MDRDRIRTEDIKTTMEDRDENVSKFKPKLELSLYKEGTVTRSGRQVKLPQKALEADI